VTACRRTGALAMALAGTLLLPLGCGLETRDADSTVNVCETMADCGSGEVCSDDGVCLSERGRRLRLALAIVAPGAAAEGESLRYATPLFEFEPGNSGPVTLPRPLTVTGQVRRADGQRVAAELFFNRQGIDLPEVRRQVRAGTFTDEQDLPGFPMPMDYTVQLTEGVSYEVVVEPRGADLYELPPLRLGARTFEDDDGDGRVALDLTYPDVELARTGGRVVDSQGRPVPCVRVAAVDPDTGLRVSSIAATLGATCEGGGGDEDPPPEDPPEDGLAGRFELAVDPTVGRYLLRLTPASPLPTLTFDPRFAAPDVDTVIALPDLAEVVYGGRVETDDGTPRPNALVTFRSSRIESQAAGTVGTVETTVRTGEDGSFELVLFAGDYTVVAQAASSARAAVLQQNVRIGRDMATSEVRGQVFVLPSRGTLLGTVTSTNGAPVSGTRVEARALNSVVPAMDVDLTDAAAFNRSGDPQVTDAEGQFSLLLDEGLYDLILRPAPGSGFPWQRALQAMGSGAPTLDRALVVPGPVSFPGVLTGHDGEPLAGAEVTAYGEVDDEAGRRLVPVGKGSTDATGAYEILLPPDL